MYSLKEDVWSVLETPPSQEPWACGALEAWDGRVFLFLSLFLWELVNHGKPTWRRFAHVPMDIHAWLVPPCFQDGNQVRVYASFSQEHVLMHTFVCETSADAPRGIGTKRFVLFNSGDKEIGKGGDVCSGVILQRVRCRMDMGLSLSTLSLLILFSHTTLLVLPHFLCVYLFM